MQAFLLLCDFAQVSQGKLYITGGGWNIHRRPGQMLIGLAVKLTADWNDANRPLDMVIRLVNEDGVPVAQGDKPLEIKGKVEFGRPAGIPPASQLVAVAGFNVGIALAPGGYRWELLINGEQLAVESFTVVQPHQMT